ncbi:ribonuclease HII [Robertkochia flava]|uniref:ribonuclease HII n=1 Tax=Robertkochia flava TaxID=3447986 RepID=UPI001CCA61E1|nr:ribonuclease HII [Robertkochia marina]
MNRQLTLLALSLVLTFSCKKEENTPSDLIAMVPEKASAVVRINNFEGFRSELRNNDLLNTLGQSATFKEGEDLVSSLQYIRPKGEALLYFSEIGKDNFEYTLVTENHNELFSIDSTLSRTLERISYDNQTINKLQIENKHIYTTTLGKFFIASSSQLPVEDLIRNRDHIKGVKELITLYGVAQRQASATLFLNNKKSMQLLSRGINSKTADVFRAMSEWSSLDLQIDKDILKGNGIAIADDSLPNILNRFKNRPPGRSGIADLAPANASYFIGIPNAKGLIKDPKNAKDSLFIMATETGFIKLGKQEVWTLEFEEDFPVEAHLLPYTQATETFRDFRLLSLNNKNLIKDRFGFLKAETSSEYAAVKAPYVFVSNNVEVLKDLIANLQNNSVISRLDAYSDLRKELADASSIELYVNLEAINANDDLLQSDLIQSVKLLENHKMLAVQYVMEGEFAHLNLLTKKKDHPKKEDHLITQLFNTTIDAPVLGKPQFVYNHRSKQKEVVVQDEENGLYLISTSGKVLWKKQLNGPILGKISQIDIYRNGRFQLAFATPGKVYVVDRNGNDVAPFPLTPEAAITQPLSVFDYDNTKNYRFCVTMNNQVQMFNREASRVTGFKMKPTESQISNPPKHIRIDKKDYIAVQETNGKLHLLFRTGEPRIRIDQNLGLSDNEVYQHNNAFIMTSAEGDLVSIDTKGKITRTKKPFEATHKIDATLHTIAAVSNNILYIKDKRVELDYGIYTEPRIFYIYDKIYIAVTDKQSHKIYLFDSEANLMENFPVYGTSVVDIDDIDNDRAIEIVTKGDKNSVVVYSLN